MPRLKYFALGFLSAVLVGVFLAGLALSSVFGQGVDNLERIVWRESFFVQGLCRAYHVEPYAAEAVLISEMYPRTTLTNRARNLMLEISYKVGHGGEDET